MPAGSRHQLVARTCLHGTLRLLRILFSAVRRCAREVCACRESRWCAGTKLCCVSLVIRIIFLRKFFFFFRHSRGECHVRDGRALVLACLRAGPRRPRRQAQPKQEQADKGLVRQKDQSCPHEVWLHQDLVGNQYAHEPRGNHEQRVLLKERCCPYPPNKENGRYDDESDRSLSSLSSSRELMLP